MLKNYLNLIQKINFASYSYETKHLQHQTFFEIDQNKTFFFFEKKHSSLQIWYARTKKIETDFSFFKESSDYNYLSDVHNNDRLLMLYDHDHLYEFYD